MEMTLSSSSASINQFVQKVLLDESLQRQLKLTSTAAGLSEVAAQAGFTIQPAEIVKHYARLLLESQDELAVRNFDRCSWDAGELLWLIKTWEL